MLLPVTLSEIEKTHLRAAFGSKKLGNKIANALIGTTATELTIASGAIVPTGSNHTVDTESDAASDALTDITGATAVDGYSLILRPASAARTVVVTHGIGANKIATPNGESILLSEVTDAVLLQHNGTQWIVLTYSTLNTATELTIDTGAIAVLLPQHTVDTEADAASDALTDITGGVWAGQRVKLRPANAARTVVVTHGVGSNKIQTPDGKSILLAESTDWVEAVYNGTQWSVIASSARNTATELTIATGVIAVTLPLHSVDTEADAASDALTDITGGLAGQKVTLYPANAARTIVVQHAVGADKIATPFGRDIRLNNATDTLELVHDGTQWRAVGGNVLDLDPQELTIATGAIAVVAEVHTVDTEADAASDALTDITGGKAGMQVVLYPANAARTVIVTHGIGADKIATPRAEAIELAEATDWVLLEYNGTQWTVVGSSVLDTPTELTIATGAIAASLPVHSVDTEADAASDTLTDITGGVAGQRLLLYPAHTDRTVIVANGTGADKIATPGGLSIYLAETTDWVELVYNGTQWTVIGARTLDTAVELTIATGAIAVTLPRHTVDTEADAASDTLSTATGGIVGQRLVLYPANAGRTVIVAHGIGADMFACPGGKSICLAEATDMVSCIHDGTQWEVIGTNVLDTPTELTIATGAIAVLQESHTVDTEADAASDTLVTATGGVAGMRLTLRPVHADRSVIIAHGIGADSFSLPGGLDITLAEVTDSAEFVHNGTQWIYTGGSSLREIAPFVYEQTTTISSAQVLTLFSVPRTIAAAPGAGFFNDFLGAVLWLDYATTAYDGVAAAEDLLVSYTNGAGLELGRVETTGFLDQAADQVRAISRQPVAVVATVGGFTPVENAAIVLSLLTAEIATGDSPLKVKCYYRKLPYTW